MLGSTASRGMRLIACLSLMTACTGQATAGSDAGAALAARQDVDAGGMSKPMGTAVLATTTTASPTRSVATSTMQVAAAGSGEAGRAGGAANTAGTASEASSKPVAQPSAAGAAGQGPKSPITLDTPYPGGRWKLPEQTYGTSIEQDVRIKMSDGVTLVGDVSYPADLKTGKRASERFPVLLTQNPYGEAFGASYGELFVTHGYIFASIDVRGTSRSEGEHDMFSPREAEDGAALVAWAAKLEGSDGKVGLQGCSQLGINQLETATKLGPDSPVKAMVPACGSGDFYRDTAFDNGIPTIVGAALASPDAADGGDKVYYREYWKVRDRLARAPEMARANIPTLLWSGWHEPGALGSLELYAALQNLSHGRPAQAKITPNDAVSGRYQVIVGDWSHGGGLDLGIQLQWFDTWIKGIDTGLPTETQTPLHLAELGGTRRWVNAQPYPLVAQYTPMYLASAAHLARTAEDQAGDETLKWTEPDTTSEAVEYSTDAISDGALLAGPIAAQLHVTSSNANIQLVIELLDRSPDGKLVRVTRGSILGTLRQTDPEKSWTDDSGLPTRPYLTLDADKPLPTGEPTLLEVPLWPTLWSIEPGHSIVVRLTTQPKSDECLEPLGVPVGCYPSNPMLTSLRGGTYRIHRGGELKSLISLPLLGHGALTTAAAAVSPTNPTKSDSAASADAKAESALPIAW